MTKLIPCKLIECSRGYCFAVASWLFTRWPYSMKALLSSPTHATTRAARATVTLNPPASSRHSTHLKTFVVWCHDDF